MDSAGIEARVAGGWAVDALAGRRTRKHLDLDLVVADLDIARAEAALETDGFESVHREFVEVAGLPLSLVWAHQDGRKVDLHPVDLDEPAFAGTEAFCEGRVGERTVRVLCPELLLAYRAGYSHTAADDHDVALLRKLTKGP